MNPTTPWRTFSVFISSTFADMQAERDHLKNIVFPKVEEELQKHRIKLEIVDLRWGVDTTSMEQEDEREANVLKVCLDEIRRCKPFFIGLLGDRYGWVPPEERMKNAIIGEGLKADLKGKSVTDLEIHFGVLASRDQLSRSAFNFREPLPYEQFTPNRAAMFSDQHNPGLSEAEKKERKASLDKLKADIRQHFKDIGKPERVKSYSAAWDAAREKVTGLEAWGENVYKAILEECEGHAKETWDQVPKNWQEQELALLDAFIEGHTHVTTFVTEKGEEHIPTFCGREPLLNELKQHLLSEDAAHWGLVLTGESGSGKSAVFSMVYKMMEQEKEKYLILAHSAGLSPRAKHVADLLQIWNNQLRKHLEMEQETTEPEKADSLKTALSGEQEKAPATPIEQLQEKFTELLGMAAAQTRVVLLIDALDRFEPTARAQHMSWLSTLMPRNVRLLCTAISGTEQKAVQYHKGLRVRSIDVFSEEEAMEMLMTLCKKQHKTLPEKIEKIILEKERNDGQPATASPLWLSLAVNILMAIDHDDFEEMSLLEGRGDQQIESYLTGMAENFDPLPGPLFLSLVNKAELLFGKEFTPAVFNYIAISRNGLREKDLEYLLPAHGIDWDPLQFAMLRRWFKAHLILQGEELQWNLAHSILDNTLLEELKEPGRKEKHREVGSYLVSLPDADDLKISETMYHLLETGNLDDVAAYYGSDLTMDQKNGATTVLAEWITRKEHGVKTALELPKLMVNRDNIFHELLRRYIYNLNEALAVEGNLALRLDVLEGLEECTIELTSGLEKGEEFGYDRAGLMEKIGSIHQAMGHMEEALKYFEQRSMLGKELYESNPRNESLKKGLAISYEKLGSIHQMMGHLKEALEYFEEYNHLSSELYETNQYNNLLKNNLAISNSKSGEIHLSMGNMEEALKYFERDLELTKELYEDNPRDESFKNSLSISYWKLGDINKKMGYMEKALEYFKKFNQLCQELYNANPGKELFK
ncbi:DUF4062 domain-containing protein, partial [bacterium]